MSRTTSPIRHRRFVALVAASVLAALPVFGAPPASADDDFTVAPGATIFLYGGGTDITDITVDPPEAGIAMLSGLDGIRFDASPLFLGDAVVSWSQGNVVNRKDVRVENKRSDSVTATFTARPQPGPCIRIERGSTIDFGIVTQGVAKDAEGVGTTMLRSCAAISQTIEGAVSRATSGSGGGTVTWLPTTQTPGPNQFQYQLVFEERGAISRGYLPDSDGTPKLSLGNLTAGFAFTISHNLLVGTGSTTNQNQPFSATVTFTAIAA